MRVVFNSCLTTSVETIKAIKTLRTHTNMGFKASKQIIEGEHFEAPAETIQFLNLHLRDFGKFVPTVDPALKTLEVKYKPESIVTMYQVGDYGEHGRQLFQQVLGNLRVPSPGQLVKLTDEQYRQLHELNLEPIQVFVAPPHTFSLRDPMDPTLNTK